MKKISLFLLFGVMQFGVDSVVYTGLSIIGIQIFYANFISRFCSAMIGYYVNGKYTFDKRSSLNTFIKFCIYWVFMTLLSSLLLFVAEKFATGKENITYIFTSKVIVEIMLFFVSYGLANRVVFKNEN